MLYNQRDAKISPEYLFNYLKDIYFCPSCKSQLWITHNNKNYNSNLKNPKDNKPGTWSIIFSPTNNEVLGLYLHAWGENQLFMVFWKLNVWKPARSHTGRERQLWKKDVSRVPPDLRDETWSVPTLSNLLEWADGIRVSPFHK